MKIEDYMRFFVIFKNNHKQFRIQYDRNKDYKTRMLHNYVQQLFLIIVAHFYISSYVN